MNSGSRSETLTYCTNVHSGEGLSDVLNHLRGPVAQVRDEMNAPTPFVTGLRLSADAAMALGDTSSLAALHDLIQEQRLLVRSLNGFPYGAFHSKRVKEQVYCPDWRDPARLEYTTALARILARLLPEDLTGSISTVPGGFKSILGDQGFQDVLPLMVEQVARLFEIHRDTGKVIVLALEPEPCCMLETVEETLSFFSGALWSSQAVALLANRLSMPSSKALDVLRKHTGICLDLCHAAVEFESPRDMLAKLTGSGLQIARIQVSSGLCLDPRDTEALEALKDFDDGVYLHQVVARHENGLRRYTDLDVAMNSMRTEPGALEWRVHFHVPVFCERAGPFGTTQFFIKEVLEHHRCAPLTQELEVETYTWDVLPSTLRQTALPQAIARELRWVKEVLQS